MLTVKDPLNGGDVLGRSSPPREQKNWTMIAVTGPACYKRRNQDGIHEQRRAANCRSHGRI